MQLEVGPRYPRLCRALFLLGRHKTVAGALRRIYESVRALCSLPLPVCTHRCSCLRAHRPRRPARSSQGIETNCLPPPPPSSNRCPTQTRASRQTICLGTRWRSRRWMYRTTYRRTATSGGSTRRSTTTTSCKPEEEEGACWRVLGSRLDRTLHRPGGVGSNRNAPVAFRGGWVEAQPRNLRGTWDGLCRVVAGLVVDFDGRER